MHVTDNQVRMVLFGRKYVCRSECSVLCLPQQPMADELSAKEAELVVLREELREKEVKMETMKTALAEAQRELTEAQRELTKAQRELAEAQRELERETVLAKERRPAIQGPPQVGGYPCMSVCV